MNCNIDNDSIDSPVTTHWHWQHQCPVKTIMPGCRGGDVLGQEEMFSGRPGNFCDIQPPGNTASSVKFNLCGIQPLGNFECSITELGHTYV